MTLGGCYRRAGRSMCPWRECLPAGLYRSKCCKTCTPVAETFVPPLTADESVCLLQRLGLEDRAVHGRSQPGREGRVGGMPAVLPNGRGKSRPRHELGQDSTTVTNATAPRVVTDVCFGVP